MQKKVTALAFLTQAFPSFDLEVRLLNLVDIFYIFVSILGY